MFNVEHNRNKIKMNQILMGAAQFWHRWVVVMAYAALPAANPHTRKRAIVYAGMRSAAAGRGTAPATGECIYHVRGGSRFFISSHRVIAR
jgi:hypothetical protein